MNLGVSAYIYKPDGFNSIVVMDPKMIINAKEEDFEKIMLVIPFDQISDWAKKLEHVYFIDEEEI